MTTITPKELREISKTSFSEDEYVSPETLSFFNDMLDKQLRIAALSGKHSCTPAFDPVLVGYSSEVIESALSILAREYNKAGFCIEKVWIDAHPGLNISWSETEEEV